jgi:hypothetical protein
MNTQSIVSHFIRSKSFAPIRAEYHVCYDAIVCLLGAYLYNRYKYVSFSRHELFKFVGYYNYKNFKYYFGLLVSSGLITQAGAKKYTITDKGIESVNLISDRSDNVISEFCNSYNIVL